MKPLAVEGFGQEIYSFDLAEEHLSLEAVAHSALPACGLSAIVFASICMVVLLNCGSVIAVSFYAAAVVSDT